MTTPANVADSTVLPDLLHGEERKVWSDGGYHPDRSNQRVSYEGPGHDLPANEAQALCGRVTKEEEPEQVERAGEGGTSVPHLEARLRLHGISTFRFFPPFTLLMQLLSAAKTKRLLNSRLSLLVAPCHRLALF